jgi:hypothetical protein
MGDGAVAQTWILRLVLPQRPATAGGAGNPVKNPVSALLTAEKGAQFYFRSVAAHSIGNFRSPAHGFFTL